MAYQNVGTPKFYISWGDWYKSLGYDVKRNHTISPVETYSHELFADNEVGLYYEDDGTGISTIPPNGSYGVNFLAVLNHNLDARWRFINKRQVTDNQDFGTELNQDGIVSVNNNTVDYQGFSLFTHTGLSEDYSSYSEEKIYSGFRTATFGELADESFTGIFGCYVWGKYFEMPHSPDLKLTMTREMDGVKRIRTKGGTDLVNHRYTKPAPWGVAGVWELYSGTPTNQALSRVGRRTWDLNFSYLQDSDIFPDVSSLTNYGVEGYLDTDPISDNTLLDEDTFYSQVIHKTNGGQLPFIFQPDSSNNNPDGFAICKFDMNSFKFKQVANGVYNIKLKIREVW